ncbi:hypothetical protein KFU94_19670 [Chloroflexi bacterium TSY]|nr:hypothetical protein [Chloroflexi bacterium TSY]
MSEKIGRIRTALAAAFVADKLRNLQLWLGRAGVSFLVVVFGSLVEGVEGADVFGPTDQVHRARNSMR